VPTDGVIKLIATNLVSGFDFVYINASTLQVEKTASISNWVNGGTGGHYPFGASYDALTDSMLMCIDSFNITFRIFFDRVGVGASLLSDVITDVWTKSGADVSLLDVSLVTGVQVRGYPITTVSNGKGILQPLCTAYFFDMVESDNLLVAVPRGQTVSTTIPETDLGLIGDQYKAMPTVMQENDLPRSITVSYYDQTLDYQTGKQMFQRNARVKKTRNQTNIGLPLTLQPDEAAHISWKALATAWAERNQWEFRLWRPSYLIIDPTDVIAFTYNGQQYTCRVSKHQIGQNLVLQVTAASENSAQYIPSNSGAGIDGFVTGTIQPLGPTLVLALDIPFVQDIDAVASGFEGYYWAAGSPTGTGWPGGQLFVSPDNQTWAGQGTDTSPATYGVVVTATPAPLTKYAWDYKTTINVRIVEGTLSSNSLVNVLNGTNWFYLGGEIMAFLNATLNADGSYTLDTLLRGLRGTEGWTGTHVVGETFLVLDDSLQHQIISSSYIGALQYIRGVTIGQAVSTSTSQQLTLQGNDLKPYAPAQFTGSVDGSSNIVASWVRRTRIGGAWLDSTGSVPISEQSESYDIAIYNSTGATLKRLVTGLTSPTFTYTAAMQTTDFGSTQASVYAIVWQNSAVVGHGFPATNPTLGSGNVVSGGSDATSILGVTITGTPADGDILQYNAGANAWEIVPFPGGTSTRTTTSKTTASLAAGASETGTWATGSKTSILLEIVASGIARVQLYSTAAFRDADNGRVFGAPPANGVESGILADFNLDTGDPSTGVATFICSPPLIASNMDGATADQMYYRITNMTGGTTTITATLTILPLEA
jgi:Putative phage tail protein